MEGARFVQTRQHHIDQELVALDLGRHAEQVEAAIVGYPHAAAAPIVAGLRSRGVKVIDLSADYRLVAAPEKAVMHDQKINATLHGLFKRDEAGVHGPALPDASGFTASI